MSQRTMSLRPVHPRLRLRGITLVELLVALVISLLGTLAIMQIYIGSETGKRATGSLSEAQSGGLVAMSVLERDIQQAGLGFMHPAVLGCTVQSNLPSNFTIRSLQPVAIIPAGAGIGHPGNHWGIPPGDAGSDMIAIAAGDSGVLIEGARLSMAAAAAATTYRLSNVQGIRDNSIPGNNDYLLVGEVGAACTLTRVQTVSASGDITVDFGGAVAYSLDGVAMHLGRRPQLLVYAVRNGVLTRCDFFVSNCANAGLLGDTSVWQPVANDVVALVAQYGFNTTSPASKIANTYCKSNVSAAGGCPGVDSGLAVVPGTDALQTVRACDWARIPVVQLALVSRSGQFEKEPVSPAALKLWPDSAVAPTTTGPVWNVPDQHYRYRITRNVVALRNALLMEASACP